MPAIDLAPPPPARPSNITEIHAEDLPVSFYESSAAPPFIEEYYRVGLVRSDTLAKRAAVRSVDATGDAMAIENDEVRTFLGLAESRAENAVVDRPPEEAIVHFLDGKFRRGPVAPFEPEDGLIAILPVGDEERRDIPLDEVEVVLFAAGDEAPLVPEGYNVSVTTLNGKTFAGIAVGYREGATSVRIVPSDPESKVACIWIPVWAVKEFNFL